MMNEIAIDAQGLTKSYAEPVLRGVDMAVARGGVFALLGPNGAGKTTAVRILATLVTPDGGRARVAGHDVVGERSQVRRRISLTGQYAALDELQTGSENLEMLGRLLGLDARAARLRARRLLAQFDLVEAGGLDPRSRQAMWAMVSELAASGVTVFLTTQYLDEADALAERIAVLDGGRIVAEGSAAQLKAQVAGQRLDLQLADSAAFDLVIERLGRRAVSPDRGALTVGVATDGGAGHVRALLDELDPEHLAVDRFSLHSASLDDVFMTLTGRHARQPESETADV
jgi:ABC-2 type transport system ATP-binding protein